MSHEYGKNSKTDYIRALLKRTHISVIYGRNGSNQSSPAANSSARDKPIRAVIKLRRPVSLEGEAPGARPEKTVTFREPMTVSGNQTMARRTDRSARRVAAQSRAATDARHRPSSESKQGDRERPTNVRSRPKTYERAEAALPKYGTIRRSYEPDKKFRPLAVFRAFAKTPETDVSNAVESDSYRENGLSPGSELETEDEELRLMDDNYPISTFPFVEDDEIDKHRKLNAEAEKLGKSRSPGPYDSYLKRLKLERKAVDQKPKDLAKGRKKLLFKRLQTKPKFIKDFKEDTPSEKPDPPPRSKEERATKMLLDFKYSYAVEQFYGSQMRNSTNFSPMSDSFVNYNGGDETEVKNGTVVKTLGANVLNLRARTLPSCNPFELRLRRQIAREKAMLQKKQSIASQASIKSHLSQESLLRLRRLSVNRKESTVSNAFLNESSSTSVLDAEYARMNTGRKSVDSQTGLPEIRIDRVENMVTRSLDSSPEGPEYLRRLSQPHKTISLNLPTVVMEKM